MSYSTQNDFFNVPFRNEDPKLPDRKRSDGALMTYDLCTDNRAWALDKQKRSNYILDVVHKARFKKALLHPEGQFELTKDYLIHLDVEDLADYILSLQGEIKRKNESVHKLEETRKSLGEQLESLQKQSDDFAEIQQQSAILEQERSEFEQQMEDVEAVIIDLKDRAERYDLLAKENELLRCQLQKQRVEAADRLRLVNAEAEASFNRLRAEECEKLEAELILFKTQYEDLRQQKRELKEQLQKALVSHSKVAELKRHLALEQSRREEIENEMERLMSLYDQQFQGPIAEDHISPENQQMRAVEQPTLQASSFRNTADAEAATSLEIVAQSCANCRNVESELANLKQKQEEELEQRDENARSLREQIETLRSKLDSMESSSGKIDALTTEEQLRHSTTELKKYQEELKTQLDKERSMQAQLEELQNNLTKLEAKLSEEVRKNEQLVAETSKAGPTGSSTSASVDDRVQELEKQLNEVKAELAEKQNRLEKATNDNAELQTTVSNFQKEIEKLEQARLQQLIELEASNTQLEASKTALEVAKTALAQTKEQMTVMGGADLDNLRKANEDLQKQVAFLESELAAAQQTVQQLQDDSGKQAELLQTVANLRAELQEAQDTVKTREVEVRELERVSEAIKSAQQLGRTSQVQQLASESTKAGEVAVRELEAASEAIKSVQQLGGASQIQEMESEAVESLQQLLDFDAEAVESLRQVRNLSIEEAELLRQLAEEESMRQLKMSAVGADGSVATVKGEDVKQEDSVKDEYVKQERQSVDSEDVKQEKQSVKDEDVKQERQSVKGAFEEVLVASEKNLEEAGGKSAVDSVHEYKKSAVSAEADAEARVDELEHEDSSEHSEDEETVRYEKSDGEGDTIRASIAQESAEKDKSEPQRHSFADDDVIRIGYSDPDKTRMIARKIVRYGVRILIIPELDHLHREICRAVIERHIVLEQNVKAIDESMCASTQILEKFKTMGNNEMMGMMFPSAQIPVHNPHLFEADELPVRIPAQSKPRPKSTSFAKYPMYVEPSVQLPAQTVPPRKSKERILMGSFDSSKAGSGSPSMHPPTKNTHDRVLVDAGCRTRAWRASKMPAEMVVASALADGSRLVSRQKWST